MSYLFRISQVNFKYIIGGKIKDTNTALKLPSKFVNKPKYGIKTATITDNATTAMRIIAREVCVVILNYFNEWP